MIQSLIQLPLIQSLISKLQVRRSESAVSQSLIEPLIQRLVVITR